MGFLDYAGPIAEKLSAVLGEREQARKDDFLALAQKRRQEMEDAIAAEERAEKKEMNATELALKKANLQKLLKEISGLDTGTGGTGVGGVGGGINIGGDASAPGGKTIPTIPLYGSRGGIQDPIITKATGIAAKIYTGQPVTDEEGLYLVGVKNAFDESKAGLSFEEYITDSDPERTTKITDAIDRLQNQYNATPQRKVNESGVSISPLESDYLPEVEKESKIKNLFNALNPKTKEETKPAGKSKEQAYHDLVEGGGIKRKSEAYSWGMTNGVDSATIDAWNDKYGY